MSDKKVFTIREAIDAIEKNGVPKIRGSFFEVDGFLESNSSYQVENHTKLSNGKVTGACALGQASLNLGVREAPQWYAVNDIYKDEDNTTPYADSDTLRVSNFKAAVVSLNDNSDKTFAEIAADLREKFADQLDVEIEAPVVDYYDS